MTALVSIKQVVKGYTRGKQRVEVLHSIDLTVEQRRVPRADGAVGLGQDDVAEPDRRARSARSRRDHGRRASASTSSRRASSRKWRARNVGFIFQFYNLLPVLTAERNVEVPLLLTKLSSAERKRNVAAALELVGLADRAKHKPAELSGGQQQRVAIARALVADPTLLVCDEPTGDLDRETSESILKLLKLLNEQQGKTIVMVTHDPRAAQYASRRLYVDKGSLTTAPRRLGVAA